MRTFYLNNNQIQTSYNCPAGIADCAAFEYLRSIPNLAVHYHMRNAVSTDIIIGPVLNKFDAGTITIELKTICKACPNYLKEHQRVLALNKTKTYQNAL